MKKRYQGRKYTPKRKRDRGNYLFIKANICLGLVICAMAAVSMSTEGEAISHICDRAGSLITTTTDPDTIKGLIKGESLSYTFAGEKEEITLDEEILREIEERSGVYESRNKGAPLKDGFSLPGE